MRRKNVAKTSRNKSKAYLIIYWDTQLALVAISVKSLYRIYFLSRNQLRGLSTCSYPAPISTIVDLFMGSSVQIKLSADGLKVYLEIRLHVILMRLLCSRIV